MRDRDAPIVRRDDGLGARSQVGHQRVEVIDRERLVAGCRLRQDSSLGAGGHEVVEDDRVWRVVAQLAAAAEARGHEDRKSTRLNSSHPSISYAVFCLKKKKK